MSTFDRATERIGDLDHPFYAEERRRDVWNEASAVGFQLVSWGLLVAAAAFAFVGGPSAAAPSLTMLGLGALGVLVAVTYAARRGVEVALTARRRGGWRGALAGGLLGLIIGTLTGGLTSVGWLVAAGAVVAGAGGVLLLEALLVRRARVTPDDPDDTTGQD